MKYWVVDKGKHNDFVQHISKILLELPFSRQFSSCRKKKNAFKEGQACEALEKSFQDGQRNAKHILWEKSLQTQLAQPRATKAGRGYDHSLQKYTGEGGSTLQQ